ncbi:hypothetical protein CDL12_17257 [Handroanthus impetiginosus]|uniref:Secreted protein n=1 Tax=Handroanthus impetiginosus TaxID=429701 RepID=A0A2G9GY00_9LAMI|nr:hypothetical protein CDL12_17257 [Handroanthus impetiginosus]
MINSESTSFLFLVLVFTDYSNALHSASQKLVTGQESSEHHRVKPYDVGCGGIRRLLVDKDSKGKEHPPQGKKKPKPLHCPNWKWKLNSPCLPKWGRKKTPPRPGPWWPPFWPPFVPVTARALRAKIQEPTLIY